VTKKSPYALSLRWERPVTGQVALTRGRLSLTVPEGADSFMDKTVSPGTKYTYTLVVRMAG
jgi:hypothetical protein